MRLSNFEGRIFQCQNCFKMSKYYLSNVIHQCYHSCQDPILKMMIAKVIMGKLLKWIYWWQRLITLRVQSTCKCTWKVFSFIHIAHKKITQNNQFMFHVVICPLHTAIIGTKIFMEFLCMLKHRPNVTVVFTNLSTLINNCEKEMYSNQ